MAEGKNLQVKRGTVATIGTLMAGEPGWATDTKVLYVGDGATNNAVLMASQATAAGLSLMDDANVAAMLATLGLTATAAELNQLDNVTLTGNNSGDQNAAGVSIADAGGLITATNVETALQEVKTAVNLNTAKVTNASHTGDVTGSAALTIAAEAVTYAKMQHVSATDKILGRATAGAGDVEEIACTATGRSILDDANAAAVLATIGAMSNADATVTYAKMQHVSATDKLLGRSTAGSGDVEEIACTAAGRALLDDAAASNQLTTLGAMPLAGGTLSGDITLGENTALALDPAGSADEKWSGITVSGTAGATLAVGDLCYLNSAWKWVLTDANAAASAGSVALGLCILAAAGDTAATNMLLMGTMRSAAFHASITGGAQLYVSTTAGDMDDAQPTGVDDVIRVIGWAVTTEPNTIYFNPSSDFITRTA